MEWQLLLHHNRAKIAFSALPWLSPAPGEFQRPWRAIPKKPGVCGVCSPGTPLGPGSFPGISPLWNCPRIFFNQRLRAQIKHRKTLPGLQKPWMLQKLLLKKKKKEKKKASNLRECSLKANSKEYKPSGFGNLGKPR